MPKAVFNGEVIAESDKYVSVEGNIYFPPESIKREFLSETKKHTRCHWKGEASYYTVKVNGKEAKDSAWYYAEPSPAAENIKDHVAFYGAVTVAS